MLRVPADLYLLSFLATETLQKLDYTTPQPGSNERQRVMTVSNKPVDNFREHVSLADMNGCHPASGLPDVLSDDRNSNNTPTTQQNDRNYNSRLALISEDSYRATPFVEALQELIAAAQSILDTSLSGLLTNPTHCEDIVRKVQQQGRRWDDSSCRSDAIGSLMGS